MREALIVEAVRTPVAKGKAVGGDLSSIHPVDLSALVLRGLVERTGIDPARIEDVIWGCVSQVGEQSFNIARNASLAAGFPHEVVGTTVDRQCGSSQQALHFAAASVIAGHCDAVIAGGVESMSRVPMFSNTVGGDGPESPLVRERFTDVNQGISAELIAERWSLSRTRLDELSAESHRRAHEAQRQGLFADEIMAMTVDGNRIDADQGIRPGSSVESLGALRTVFKDDGVVTAGNSSQISDGSAALLVTSADFARENGLRPIARVHSVALAGVDPVMKLTGPIPATEKVLKRAGLSIDDIGAFEINEAFASVFGAWLVETGAAYERANPLGGAIALGHPLGGSGARLMTTMLHHMRRNNIQYGLQSMCEGGGMANATIVELIDVR